MMLYDFKCSNEECGLVEEQLVYNEDHADNCSACGAPVLKCVSSPGLLVTNSHDKPKVRARNE